MNQSIRPSGVIFDFDGVVVDSLSVHLDAWRVSFKTLYGVELENTDGLPGRSTAAIADILSTRAGQPESKETLASLKRDILRQTSAAINFLPGVQSAFMWLRGEKIPFGIASNAPRKFIETTLAELGESVSHIFGCDDVMRPKPEPDVFLKCAKALSLSVLQHEEIIVFEDSPHGLRAAVKAGMFPIGVLTQNSAEHMIQAGAMAVCKDVGDALQKGWLSSLPRQS
jgi:HAD superfamily hydrolase (TIGR01509 family)